MKDGTYHVNTFTGSGGNSVPPKSMVGVLTQWGYSGIKYQFIQSGTIQLFRSYNTGGDDTWASWIDISPGNLYALTTTAKDSLVSAVNEVNNLVSPVKVGSTATTNKFTVDTTALKTGLYLITANLPSTAEVGSVFVFTKTNVGNDGMSKIFKIFSTHDETIIEGGNIEFFSGSWYSDVYLKKII